MKQADALWVENLARLSCGKPLSSSHSAQFYSQSINDFIDELAQLLSDYSSYFNSLVAEQNPTAQVRALRLGNPRPGVMLLRGKEKLVISLDGARSLRARLTEVKGMDEQSFDIMEFEPQETANGDLAWLASNGHSVTAELVAKSYGGPFLVHGGKAFAHLKSAAQTQALS